MSAGVSVAPDLSVYCTVCDISVSWFQEYLKKLRQIRLLNFNERQQIRARLRGEKVCAPKPSGPPWPSPLYLLTNIKAFFELVPFCGFCCRWTVMAPTVRSPARRQS